jgi:hypothetical protein
LTGHRSKTLYCKANKLCTAKSSANVSFAGPARTTLASFSDLDPVFYSLRMARPLRDAEQAGKHARRDSRYEAGHRYVWIHVRGAWRSGVIVAWFRQDAGWCCWVQHDHPDGHPWPTFALYVYDADTIVRRDPFGNGSPP